MKFTCVLLGLIFAVVGCAPTPPLPRANTKNVVAGLITCLQRSTCDARVVVQKLADGDTMSSISGPGIDKTFYQYFYTERKRFGVIVTDQHGNVDYLEDNDFDGKVDHVRYVWKGTGTVALKATDPDYPVIQALFIELMDIAREVLPREPALARASFS